METGKLKVRIVWSEMDLFREYDDEGSTEEMSVVSGQYHPKARLLDSKFGELISSLEKKHDVHFERQVSDCFFQLSLEHYQESDAGNIAQTVLTEIEQHLGD